MATKITRMMPSTDTYLSDTTYSKQLVSRHLWADLGQADLNKVVTKRGHELPAMRPFEPMAAVVKP